ncbi:hypothetical protein K435DRAFT_876724 [Dendrothele bispora CBS 962.96]|uniref:Uncharacterized protein n=1 Tax=Dendrothele bispora (strain CBS 962.96) TaxID=1314807 RepID=A0A4S8KRQ4_DENBC|nr:hypothetical protein K435DRAFT_876724 [Dendrothele bispora CBS 962.96]
MVKASTRKTSTSSRVTRNNPVSPEKKTKPKSSSSKASVLGDAFSFLTKGGTKPRTTKRTETETEKERSKRASKREASKEASTSKEASKQTSKRSSKETSKAVSKSEGASGQALKRSSKQLLTPNDYVATLELGAKKKGKATGAKGIPFLEDVCFINRPLSDKRSLFLPSSSSSSSSNLNLDEDEETMVNAETLSVARRREILSNQT